MRSGARADCSFGTAPTDMASGESAPSTAAKSANLGTAAIGLSGGPELLSSFRTGARKSLWSTKQAREWKQPSVGAAAELP